MMEINANIETSASSSPHSYSPNYRRRLTASVPFDRSSGSPIITSTAFRNPACGSGHASPNSEFIVEEEYEESLVQFADIILDGFKSRSNPSSRKSPDTFSAWSDAALPIRHAVPIHCTSVPFTCRSGVDMHHQQKQHSQQHVQLTETPDITPPPTNFGSYEKSCKNNTINFKDTGNILGNINPTGIYNEPCDAKPTVDTDDPVTIYTTRNAVMKITPIGVNHFENSLPTNDNCSHHVDHHDCGCTQHHVNSLDTTPTAGTPLLPSTIKTTTESLQGNHSPSPISCITPLVNTSEIHVISNSVGIQSKSNNNNNNNSQSSVCFASSPRGNTVITHHPASPFARVPRGPILKNEINSKVSMQSVQSSAFKASITSTAVTATAITTTTIAAINTTSYSDNVSSANTSMVGLSPVQTEFSLNSSDSSSKQPFHINGSRETNVLCNESNQLRHGEDKIKSVSTQSPVNNRNNPMGSGRTRSSVCSSYPTYEEAWDLKLARQLGIGVSRLPSIIPISSTIPNYVPSLPSIPSDVTVVDRSSVILGQDNQRNVISPQSLSLYNREQLNERKSILLSNDSHSIESNLKLLNVTSSDDKLTKLTNNNSEVLINDDVNDDGDKNLVCNSKEITTGQLNRKSANGGGGSGINRLFYHNEHSHLSSHSSHMANGKTDLTENNGEYDYAYNGSWSMGVKFNLNLAINNSSNDSSVIPITPKYTNTMTTALTKTVKSNQADIQSSIHYPGSSNLFHPTSSAPPIIPSHHRQHHQLQHGLSSSQSHQSTRLNSVKNEDDFKCKPISQPVISNDLDSVSTDSCDESWDTRHGQLVSELMRGRFIDPSVIIPTTGKVTNTIPAVTTMAMNPESSCLPETNILAVPNPASSSSCTSSSLSSSSSSSSSSSTSTSSSTSHVILSSPPLPSSQCTNSVSDQFTTSSGLRYPLNKVKALSSQHNLPKGLPANLETLPLEEQLWFHPSLTRSEAEELIRNEPEGSFLVRPSETCPNDFSLTIKHKSFLHMKISRNSAGQFILGEYSQPYTSVSQMIYHYARTLVPVLGAYSVTLTHPVFKRT
ncbi:unnamed protein product [Heterobilharzia americana]|nr:unnamed protein product [Heterobilharzia americana]